MSEKTPPKHNQVLPDPRPDWAEPARATFERYWESTHQEDQPKPERDSPPDLGDDFRKGTGPNTRKRAPFRGR